MALRDKLDLFKGRIVRVAEGASEKTENGLIQISLINGATKESKGIFIGEIRRDELATELERAAKALRTRTPVERETPQE